MTVLSSGSGQYVGASGQLFPNVDAIIYPNTVKAISYIDKFEFYWNGSMRATVKRIVLPEQLEIIPERMFDRCEELYSIKMPKNLKEIGNLAFYKCNKLKSIKIPKSVEILGDRVFQSFKNNQTINIEIEENAIPAGWATTWRSYCSAQINWGAK